MLLQLILAFAINDVDTCMPISAPLPRLSVAFAGIDKRISAAPTVVLRSDPQSPIDHWPWYLFPTVKLIPEHGTALVAKANLTAAARDPAFVNTSKESFAAYEFSPTVKGRYRVSVTSLDPAVPQGCTPIIWDVSMGDFNF